MIESLLPDSGLEIFSSSFPRTAKTTSTMASSASHSYPPKDHQTSSGTGATTTATANGGPSALSSSDSRRFRVQGWDPILIVAQIVVIQTIHYLTLALVVPPLLSIFSDPLALEYEGGSANIAMIMDWREMAGWGTLARHGKLEAGGWAGHGVLPEGLGRRPLRLSDAANRQDAGGAKGLLAKVEDGLGEEWGDFVRSTSAFDIAADPRRGWVLAVAWAIASLVGCVWSPLDATKR